MWHTLPQSSKCRASARGLERVDRPSPPRVRAASAPASQVVESGNGKGRKDLSDRSVQHPRTPDGHYFVRGRLWRTSKPDLDEDERQQLVGELMAARRAVRDAAGGLVATAAGRAAVDAAKVALGERGPVWWGDGAPDYNRHSARTTPYAAWYASVGRT